jgi:hypothetical protein
MTPTIPPITPWPNFQAIPGGAEWSWAWKGMLQGLSAYDPVQLRGRLIPLLSLLDKPPPLFIF